jgi:hypothetical protein
VRPTLHIENLVVPTFAFIADMILDLLDIRRSFLFGDSRRLKGSRLTQASCRASLHALS